MSTLRVFKSLKKNCYSFTADKGSLLLVRASFFYGNYDKKSSPPSFRLLFDGNYWATVNTTLDELETYEVMYVVKSDTTSICLAQTQPNQLPFISALAVRKLDSTMYGYVDPNYALFVRLMDAFGANSTVRYGQSLTIFISTITNFWLTVYKLWIMLNSKLLTWISQPSTREEESWSRVDKQRSCYNA